MTSTYTILTFEKLVVFFVIDFWEENSNEVVPKKVEVSFLHENIALWTTYVLQSIT